MKKWRRLEIILVIISVVLLLPAVFSGYLNDDYLIGSPLLESSSPINYYDFHTGLRGSGLVPWWIADGMQLRFFRPLSSLSLHLDFTLFEGLPLVAHLHSVIWFVLFLLGSFRLLRQLLGDDNEKRLRWAMIFLALGLFHTWAAGWIAARHAIMGGTFAVWSALFYLRWREGGTSKHAVISLVLFIIGLLSSESGLGLLGLVVGYETMMAQGSLKKRLSALAIYLTIGLTYVFVYKILNYGPAESALYVEPFSEPLQYFGGAIPKTLALIAVFTLGVPAMMRVIPGVESVPTIAGVIAVVFLLIGFFMGRKKLEEGGSRRIIAMALISCFGMAPALSGMVEGRGVLLSGVVFAAVTGTIVANLFATRGRALTRIGSLSVALFLCLGLLVLSPLSRLGAGAFMFMGSKLLTEIGEDESLGCQSGTRVYVVNSDFFTGIGAPFVIAKHQEQFFTDWEQLVLVPGEVTMERTGEDRLRFSHDESVLVGSMRMYCEDFSALTQGRVIQHPGITVEILEVSPSGAGPTEVEFTIQDLDNPQEVCLLTVDRGRLHPVTLPEVGSSTTVSFNPPDM